VLVLAELLGLVDSAGLLELVDVIPPIPVEVIPVIVTVPLPTVIPPEVVLGTKPPPFVTVVLLVSVTPGPVAVAVAEYAEHAASPALCALPRSEG
jgi:hypothetical protein